MKLDSVATGVSLPEVGIASTSGFFDGFISYGRPDSKGFAIKLCRTLEEYGYHLWFDQNDLPLGVDFQAEIDDALDKSDNLLFIISPHSINSPYCGKELDLALRRSKRIIPLMHVEEISWETWLTRNPNGTEADWMSYRAAGKHSSYLNMHPTIGRLNWVFFREGVDDFERSLQGLIEIFVRDRQYIQQHTYFLSKALTWERLHKQPRYLLIQEERLQAESWLKTNFQDQQPPCIPTDLHCEFITESTKNANNLMTDVFLSYAETNLTEMENMRRLLMRENFTVWTNKRDIQTGIDFQKAINRGIEEATSIVYLISPDAVRSRYCKQEIKYALSLNKRIIPIIISPIELEDIPEHLRVLQFINFTDNISLGQEQDDWDKLLSTLRRNVSYYEYHKVLLVKALKWERQKRNPSLLLRGYDLRHAVNWLEIAQNRDHCTPTGLQAEFITESQRQPPGTAVDVFISYSRRNSDFARKLNDTLQIHGKTTWFDQESLAAGAADFGQEIRRGIETSNHFLFVISPSAVESPYCFDEVEYATRLGKRIITVLHRPVTPEMLHPSLSSVQWIDFNQNDEDFNANFSVLMRALENDPVYLRSHTRLLMRALEWDQQQRDDSFLLRGSDLNDAEKWLLGSEGKLPQPTHLQQEYITTSRRIESARQQAEIQRQRLWLRVQHVGLAVVGLISILATIFGVVALQQREQARQARQTAQRERQIAQRQQVAASAITAEALFQSNRTLEALLQSMRTGVDLERHGLLNETELRNRVVDTLQDTLFWVQERNRIDAAHQGIVWELSTSPNQQLIASASGDKTVRLWRRDGTPVAILPNDRGFQMYGVAFAPGGDRLLSTGEDGIVQEWSTQGEEIKRWQAHTEPVVSAAYAPDGTLLATASEDRTVRLWTAEGRLLATLQGHVGPVRYVSFSPDGQLLATASDDGTIRLWDRTGRLLNTLRGHTAQVLRVRFSPDGQKLVSASWDNTVRLWMRNGARILTIPAHNTLVNDAAFSPDGTFLVSTSTDKTIKVWTPTGRLITRLVGHDSEIRSVAFLGSATLVSGGGDRSLRIWQLGHPLLKKLRGHWSGVYAAQFSPNDQEVATAGADHTIHLWNRQGDLLRVLRGHGSVVWDVAFSPDGSILASGSSDHTVKLWHRNGTLITTLVGPAGPVRDVVFSPDGRLIAAASIDRRVYLWRWDGKTATPFNPPEPIQSSKGILAIAFSPDGKTLATGGWDTQIQLWNLQGKPLAMLGRTHRDWHSGWIYAIAFSPNGRHIATASSDNTIKLWTADGQPLRTLTGHQDGVVALQYSQGGDRLVSASLDGTVAFWTADGDLLTNLHNHSSGIQDHNHGLTDVALSRDGQLLISASQDQAAQLWNIAALGDLEQLMAQGCTWLQDYFKTHPEHAKSKHPVCKQFPRPVT